MKLYTQHILLLKRNFHGGWQITTHSSVNDKVAGDEWQQCTWWQ